MKDNFINKIILISEIIFIVIMIILLKLNPFTLYGLFLLITLICNKIILDNILNYHFENELTIKTIKINLFKKKTFTLVGLIIITLSIIYYSFSIINIFKIITIDEINNTLPSSCRISLDSEYNDIKYYSNSKNLSECNYEIYFVKTNKKNDKIYNDYVNIAINNNENSKPLIKTTSWDGFETVVEGTRYNIIYQKRNTIIYISSDIQFKNDIKSIMKKTGYISEAAYETNFN